MSYQKVIGCYYDQRWLAYSKNCQWSTNKFIYTLYNMALMFLLRSHDMMVWPYRWEKTIHKFTLLTHWGRVMHICVGKLTIIGLDNGLSPGRHPAIIRTNAGILLIGTNFSEILSEIHPFSFKKMHLKMSSGRWRQFYLGLNMLTQSSLVPQNEIMNHCLYSQKHQHSKYDVWLPTTSVNVWNTSGTNR